MAIRLLLADDHAMVRRGLQVFLAVLLEALLVQLPHTAADHRSQPAWNQLSRMAIDWWWPAQMV